MTEQLARTMRGTSALLLLALAATAVDTAHAFGGFFGRAAPERPVTSTGDAIVFGVNDDKVQLQVQLDYDYGDAEFGWILPVPVVPTRLDIGSSLLFHALFQETLPTFMLDINEAATTRQGGQAPTTLLGETCPASTLANQNCPIQGATRNGREGSGLLHGIRVLEGGSAGFVNYEVLQGSKNSVLRWLQANNFVQGSNRQTMEALLDYYDATNTVYIALKLQPGAPKGAVQPFLVEYTVPVGSVHKVPTLLSATSPRTLQVYFLSNQPNSRAIPVNYLDVELDDTYVDWVGCLSPLTPGMSMDECYYKDYQRRYRQATHDVVNQTLTTEYFGPSNIVGGKIAKFPDVAQLQSSPTWLDFLQQLEDAGIPPIPAVQSIIDQYIIPKVSFDIVPPFQCAQWDHVYQPQRSVSPSMNDCYEIFLPPEGWTWDPIGLATQLEQLILAPARAAENLITVSRSLTRLYGQLVAPSTTPEPHFTLQTGLPMVDNMHRASAVPLCSLGSPSALEITLADDDKSVFWQPAVLSCPTWQKTSPKPVFDRDAATAPRGHSLAALFTAWGGPNTDPYTVPRDNDGNFNGEEIDTALQYGDAVLATMTGHPAVEIPGVPAAGTTYIDVMTPTDDEWLEERGSSSRSNWRRRGTMVVSVAMACMAVLFSC